MRLEDIKMSKLYVASPSGETLPRLVGADRRRIAKLTRRAVRTAHLGGPCRMSVFGRDWTGNIVRVSVFADGPMEDTAVAQRRLCLGHTDSGYAVRSLISTRVLHW